jgi:hypothetical protein
MAMMPNLFQVKERVKKNRRQKRREETKKCPRPGEKLGVNCPQFLLGAFSNSVIRRPDRLQATSETAAGIVLGSIGSESSVLHNALRTGLGQAQNIQRGLLVPASALSLYLFRLVLVFVPLVPNAGVANLVCDLTTPAEGIQDTALRAQKPWIFI